MNYENSKTSDPRRLLLNLIDKTNLKRIDKYVALTNLSIYYTLKNIKKSYKNNKFKISAPTWNEEFELPDRPYSVSDIQDSFKYILKNMMQFRGGLGLVKLVVMANVFFNYHQHKIEIKRLICIK